MRKAFSHIGWTAIAIVMIGAIILILGNERIMGDFSDSTTAFAQSIDSIFTSTGETQPEGPPVEGGAPQTPLWDTDWGNAYNILVTLLLATVLSALISYRRGGGKAQMDFTEAHIVLSVAAALMMMIIGSQIARAFGLMGAASIVRYRYSLKSPKEASSLVIALGVGMACGVGLFPLAIIASLYIVVMIFIFEHLPGGMKRALFPTSWNWNLRVRTLDSDDTLARMKEILADEEVVFKIKRVRGDRGPNRDQTEIEVEISGYVDRNHFAEEITGPNVIRVRWKRAKSSSFDDLEIEK